MNTGRMRKSIAMDVVIGRDGKRCFWCNIVTIKRRRTRGGNLPRDTATLDHVIPISDGGSNDTENLVLACVGCNGRRKNMDFIAFGIRVIVEALRRNRKCA